MLETCMSILGFMVFLVIALFLLDLIVYMLSSMIGISLKKALAGFAVGMGVMAIKRWYNKNHVVAEPTVTVEEKTEETVEEKN